MPSPIHRVATLAAALFLPVGASLAQDIRFNVVPYKLDNGLKILALEDQSVPGVSYYTVYRVGSRNERPGRTGISHLFEHMMFNGSKKYGPGVFDRTIESKGGVSNAFTTEDITVYYESIPSEALDVVVDMEADRMAALTLNDEILNKERDVVKEERRLRTDNDLKGAMLELLAGTAYVAHPYQWPVVGWMADLDAITVADCQEYFRLHYAPNNATIILVGDFKPDRAVALIGKAYGSIPSQPATSPIVRDEPEQQGERRVTLKRAAQLPAVAFAYHVPETASDDVFALDLLEILLTEGESSLLNKRLVYEQELATQVESENIWRVDPSMFVIYAEAKPGVTAAALESALAAELDGLAQKEMPDAALQKARNIRTTRQVKALKTSGGKAEQLGMFEVYFGGYARLFTILKSYEAFTKADLRRVAAKYLKPDNRTVVTLVPAGSGGEPKP